MDLIAKMTVQRPVVVTAYTFLDIPEQHDSNGKHLPTDFPFISVHSFWPIQTPDRPFNPTHERLSPSIIFHPEIFQNFSILKTEWKIIIHIRAVIVRVANVMRKFALICRVLFTNDISNECRFCFKRCIRTTAAVQANQSVFDTNVDINKNATKAPKISYDKWIV